jgi:hypothetical protein
MSGRAALSEAVLPRVLVLDNDQSHEVFDTAELVDGIIRARSAFLFEIGEELRVRVEHEGGAFEATARVRGHTGPDDAKVTELELSDKSDVARQP